MTRYLAITAICVATTGCVVSQERISALPDLDLCRGYGVFSQSMGWNTSAERYKQEIINRKAISQAEWEMVNQQKIQRGMSQCAMYAAWGAPDRENRSVGSWGVHIQHVYNTGYRHIKPSYVYTENGRVTAWQN